MASGIQLYASVRNARLQCLGAAQHRQCHADASVCFPKVLRRQSHATRQTSFLWHSVSTGPLLRSYAN